MKALSSCVCGKLAPLPARAGVNPPRGSGRSFARRPVRVAAGQSSLLHTVETRLSAFFQELGAEAAATSTRVQHCLLSLVLLLQRAVRWAQLAAAAVQLHSLSETQQQAGTGGSDDDSSGSVSPSVASAPVTQQQVQPPAVAVLGFISAVTMGAVEQMRRTLTDDSNNLDCKMSVIQSTTSGLQGTLFQAAQAHSEAVRLNPSGGMWKQPCVASVISEEERLRQAVFEQVYAELCQKDNNQLGFYAQP
ncbi:hypothetical protein ACK3TF_000072 [Chlorella vulgaris]